jgi:hypothetical protein
MLPLFFAKNGKKGRKSAKNFVNRKIFHKKQFTNRCRIYILYERARDTHSATKERG